jgi:hypothetical protein
MGSGTGAKMQRARRTSAKYRPPMTSPPPPSQKGAIQGHNPAKPASQIVARYCWGLIELVGALPGDRPNSCELVQYFHHLPCRAAVPTARQGSSFGEMQLGKWCCTSGVQLSFHRHFFVPAQLNGKQNKFGGSQSGSRLPGQYYKRRTRSKGCCAV